MDNNKVTDDAAVAGLQEVRDSLKLQVELSAMMDQLSDSMSRENLLEWSKAKSVLVNNLYKAIDGMIQAVIDAPKAAV